MNKNLISVIIPCYNQEKYLPEALNSVLNQTYTTWECIIVNDGSPDNTENIAIEWCKKDSRFKYIKKENGGLSSARNAGLKEAKGEFIQFLDADDLIAEKKFEIQLKIFEEHKDIDIVYALVRYFSSEKPNELFFSIDKGVDNWQPEILGDNDKFLCSLIVGNIMACNCPLIRKSIIEKVGYFNELIPSHEDYELWIRIAILGGHIRYHEHPETYAFVRIHNESMSNDSLKMKIGFMEAKYILLKYLIVAKKNCGLNLKFQYRSIKKRATEYYLNDIIDAQKFSNFLNRFERCRFKLLKFIPFSLRFQFMIFDIYEVKKIIRKVI